MRQPALSGVIFRTTHFCGPYPFCTQSLFYAYPFLLANRSFSSGAAEVATKTVTSWSNALDAPNEDRCGLFDVGAPRCDQCGQLDAPNDNQCTPNEPAIASSEASATVPILVGITAHNCPECSP